MDVGAVLALHTPDGFLSIPTALAAWGIAAIAVGVAVVRSNRQIGERTVPLMGVMAAFIFAAQMINFPVAGGTSGHMLGGALAAILLGPWAAILVMTSVIAIQALLFQDGGLVVMGANILCMGVVTSFIGYGAYRAAVRALGETPVARIIGGFTGAWLSVMAAAILLTLFLATSGTSPLSVALPAMAGVHALIGIGEGLITVGALSFIMSARKDLLEPRAAA
jgi:cobalt/nickel transport system permease protein